MNWNIHSRSLNLADDRGTLFLSFDRKSERRLRAWGELPGLARLNGQIIRIWAARTAELIGRVQAQIGDTSRARGSGPVTRAGVRRLAEIPRPGALPRRHEPVQSALAPGQHGRLLRLCSHGALDPAGVNGQLAALADERAGQLADLAELVGDVA
jgi:hypothetical protein